MSEDVSRNRMKRGFTLIELLVIVAILGVMVTMGVVSIRSGQGAARVKAATRDIYASIRHARSTALVTGQPAIITYSTEEVDGEVMAKIEVTKAELFSSQIDRSEVQTLSGEPIKGEDQELVHIEKAGGDAIDGTVGDGKGGGETLEDVLFSPINADVVKGMRLKVMMEDEIEADKGRKPRVSVFSNVDYLIGKFKNAKAAAKKAKEDENADGKADDKVGDERQEPVSVAWESNGRVDPHRVWVYADGQRPEDGLLIKIDRFGAAKVLSGDGREDD